MNSRVLTFLFTLALGLGLLVAEGFCTTAKKVSPDGKEMRHISQDSYPPETMQAISSPSKYSTAGSKDELDCYLLIPDPEVPAVTEHDLVGLTWYDYQKNGSMGRMISVTSAGTGGYRHVSWMWTAGVFPGVQRRVYARTKPLAGAWSTLQEVGLGTVNSGYCNQTHFNDGNPVVIFHRTGIGGNWCYLSVADAPSANPLYSRKWDLPDVMPDGSSGETGAWPKCEVLYCIDETVHPDPLNYIHIIENEGNTEGNAESWIGYLRCYIDPTDVNNLKCQTPTTGGEVYNIPANTAFQDEVYSFADFSSCDISPVVVTGRGIVGQRVAVPYMPPAADGTCDYLSDVAYIECLDNGHGWIEGYDWPPTVHRITNFGTTRYERAYHDLSACYDYDDSLHIVYVTSGFDPASPGIYQPGVARLYHWSKENGISIIASKIQEGANPSAHNLNLSKMSISAKDPIYHPGGDSTYLFCIWTQVDSSDQNAAGDFGNQDLFGSGSFDGGNTWGKVVNLTGTHTPGCMAGVCVSEHWPSIATNMLNGDLHVEYICDRDAGAAVMDEGTWTENYVMYVRQPEWRVKPEPRGAYKITEPDHWHHPPIKVLPNQTRTIRFKVFSIGNEALTYSVTSDQPCVQVSVPPSQLQPKDSIEISVLLDGTGACNGTFIAGNVVLSTDEAGGKTEFLRVHAVVTEDYYECPRDPETVDTLENDYLKLYVNANCQQWIHDIGWDIDTTHEVFFRGGTIVATTSGGDTLVGRFMGDNDMRAGAQDKLYKEQCEPDWEPHFWILYTKDIYIEASHLNPPNHFKWFWWEISKQVKFFKDTAPQEYQRIVIKYIKVKRQDPPGWWPDLTPFTDYEDTYIGFAMDLDAPSDGYGGPESGLGDENACNYGRYDATNEIAYVSGFGREHPEYNDYHAGIALAEVNGVPTTTPFATANIKNNFYLYPQSPWGWLDGELYRLASTPGNHIQDPDVIVDRSVVLTASKIDAGTDPDAEAEFTLVEVLAPEGEAQMQALIDTARAIVAREREHGIPAYCGDVDGDGAISVMDALIIIDFLYRNATIPCPHARADCNSNGLIDIGDFMYLINYLFREGPPPNCPGISFTPLGPPEGVESESDTMYIEPWPEDIGAQGKAPYFVRVPIYVTNEVANPWDSIRAFVVPLCYTKSEPSLYCRLTTERNNTNLYPFPADGSIFRHFVEGSDTLVHNRMMDLSQNVMGQDWDVRILDLDGTSHFQLMILAGGTQDQRWWEGSRVLLATMTFELEDTMQVCIDTCFWEHGRLSWISDSENIVPLRTRIPRPGTGDPNSFEVCFGPTEPQLDCGRSYSDPCLVACPLGDIPFRLYLRNTDGAPMAGYSNVWLDFSDCSGIIPCSAETSWAIVHPDGPSDSDGVVTFHVQAGGCDDLHQAQVMAGCGLIGYVPVKTVDTDGNHVVTVSDWHHLGVDPCNDYNCNDEINFWDLDFFREHINHVCDPDPCLLISQDLIVTPDTLLPEDSLHTVQLFIRNNHTEPCTAQFVKFFRGGFGQGPALVQFETSYLWEELLTGEVAVAEADFVVPEYLPGHIMTKLYTSCCDDSLAAIFDFAVRICPPASMVYQFPIVMDFVPAYVETLDYIPEEQGWSWFTSTVGDTLWVNIVTPATSALGIAGGVALYFFDYDWNLLAYRTCEVRITLNSGDVSSDCIVNVGDIVYLVNYLYRSGVPPNPLRAGDVNCDCVLNVGDVVYLVNYLFRSGVPPAPSETCECGYKEWFPR